MLFSQSIQTILVFNCQTDMISLAILAKIKHKNMSVWYRYRYICIGVGVGVGVGRAAERFCGARGKIYFWGP